MHTTPPKSRYKKSLLQFFETKQIMLDSITMVLINQRTPTLTYDHINYQLNVDRLIIRAKYILLSISNTIIVILFLRLSHKSASVKIQNYNLKI